MQSLFFDLRHILRSLLNHPIFSLSVIVMLSLGIGLVLFMFGVMQSTVFKQPPYEDPQRIAHIELEKTLTGERNIHLGIHTYLDLAEQQATARARGEGKLERMAAYYVGSLNFSAVQAMPERLEGVFTTEELFRVLGELPIAGRDFTAEDLRPGAPPVVILGHALWRRNFSSNTDINSIIGSTVRINGQNSVVIGVMPEGFRFPLQHDIWVPMNLDVWGEPRNSGNLVDVVARLSPGHTMAEVQSEVQGALEHLNAAYPAVQQADRVVVKPLADEMLAQVYRDVFNIMMLAVVLVLLVACINVGGLLAARAATRQRERTIRSVLGATRGRLLWEGLLESLLLTSVAGILGLFLAVLAIDWFMQQLINAPNPPPSWALDFHFNPVLVATSLLAVLLTALISGLYPAWQAARNSASQAMREGSNGSIGSGIGRLGRYLISVEIALSLVLLVGAGLVQRTVWNIQHIEIGADISYMVTGRIALLHERYRDTDTRVRFLRDIQHDLELAVPNGRATIGGTLPMTLASLSPVSTDENHDENEVLWPSAVPLVVAANYFEFFRIPILHGHGFNGSAQNATPLVVVISQSLAERLWGNPEDALLQRLYVKNSHGDYEARQVIGIVGEVEYDGEDLGFSSGQKQSGAYYVPLWQSDRSFWSVALSAVSDKQAFQALHNDMSAKLRGVILEHDPDMAVYWLMTMDEWLKRAISRHELLSTIFLCFGLSALGLTATGLYSLLAFTVTCRTREIGVHRALGAPTLRILAAVLRESMQQLLIGAAVGLALSILFARPLSHYLYEVSAFDPLSFLGAVLFFTLVCISASLVPALRAVRITPMQALRYE